MSEAGGAPLAGSAAGLVVGATDLSATVAFLAHFGFVLRSEREVASQRSTSLYHLDRPTTEVRLSSPGVDRPSLWVVGCDEAGVAPTDFERRSRALDVYTSDMDASLAALGAAGVVAGPVGTLAVGPVTMRQCLILGPDGLPVVLVESTHRRGSTLDDEPTRLHSEAHSVVWCVDSMDDEARFFADAGLTKGMDLAFTEPEVSTYLDLPRSPVPIRMTMLAGSDNRPLRLELLEFPSDPGPARFADHLIGGIAGLVFECASAASAADALQRVGFAVTGSSDDVVALRSPGGVGLQLRER